MTLLVYDQGTKSHHNLCFLETRIYGEDTDTKFFF